MSDNKKIFISWSGEVSGKLAAKLCEAIEELPLSIDCWISQRFSDLSQGAYDHARIIEAARNAEMCISVLTPENTRSPWLLFEAGMFYGAPKPIIGMLCCNLSHNTLKQSGHPLEGYHSYLKDERSFMAMIDSINQNFNNIDKKRYEKAAKASWKSLSKEATKLCTKFQDPEMASESSA